MCKKKLHNTCTPLCIVHDTTKIGVTLNENINAKSSLLKCSC